MLPRAEYAGLVAAALAEDIGSGDLTTECTVPPERQAVAVIVAKAPGVLAGQAVAAEVFTRLSPHCRFEGVADGTRVVPGTTVAEVQGPARALLAGERVALNFLQHLSGIATLTRRFVDAVAGTQALISDTRKTTPLLRALEKYAVRCGGGTNHRSRLDAMLLVKENHIAAAGSVRAALEAALGSGTAHGVEVEVEVRTWEEFEVALALQPQRILLDHWDPAEVARAVGQRGSVCTPLLEVSGNLSLATVRAYAEAGADILSVGALTHSAPALDLSLLVRAATS
jgi:nicotinate-nucleotide pyrophosphorylase (carboxylating)